MQRPGIVKRQPIDAFATGLYLLVITAGRYVELLLQIVALTPGLQVNAFVQTIVHNCLEHRHTRPPPRLIAYEVVVDGLAPIGADRTYVGCTIKRNGEAGRHCLGYVFASAKRITGRIVICFGLTEQLEQAKGALDKADEFDLVRRLLPEAKEVYEHTLRAKHELGRARESVQKPKVEVMDD